MVPHTSTILPLTHANLPVPGHWLIYILTWVRTGMEKDAPSLVTLQEDLMALHKLIVNEIITKDEFKTLRRNALEPYGIQPKD